VIALALALGASDSESDKPPARRPAAALSGQDVARIARRVEVLRKLRFVRPVKPLFVGRAQAVRMVEQGSEQDYPVSAQKADEEALKLLGLLKPSDDLPRALAAISREEVLGFYDDRRRRLVVVRERNASRQLLEITLAHELTHALEDQRFGLDVHGSPTDDAAIAQSSLAEGSATSVMLDYAKRHFKTADALALLNSVGDDTKLPKYIEDTLLFPYDEGLRFIETFRGGSGNWNGVDNVLRFRRPRSVEQILHADKYARDERPDPVRLPGLGLVLGNQWERLGVSSVSELDLREIFSIVGGRPDESAAAGWGGGRFELWRRGGADAPGCAEPCVRRDVGLVKLAWDTSSDRKVAEEALAKAFERGLSAKRLPGKAGVRLWSSRGGVIALESRGRETAIVLAPDAALVGRVLSTEL
jgi:hypothetical protein